MKKIHHRGAWEHYLPTRLKRNTRKSRSTTVCTRNERKEGEFQNEMTEFFGSNPKIVQATVSSMAMEAERADHSPVRTRNFPARRYSKRKSEGCQSYPRQR